MGYPSFLVKTTWRNLGEQIKILLADTSVKDVLKVDQRVSIWPTVGHNTLETAWNQIWDLWIIAGNDPNSGKSPAAISCRHVSWNRVCNMDFCSQFTPRIFRKPDFLCLWAILANVRKRIRCFPRCSLESLSLTVFFPPETHETSSGFPRGVHRSSDMFQCSSDTFPLGNINGKCQCNLETQYAVSLNKLHISMEMPVNYAT
jgi:hypothetical protein